MKKSFFQRIKIPHVFVLLTGVILFSSILTYLVPSGNYQREERTVNGLTRTMVIPGTFASHEKHYSLEEMVVAALVVGFAKGIQVVLQDGQIMDTLIYGAANVLQDFPKMVAAEGMLVFQSLLNLFIPSGSGQAAATMPLMAPLSDVLGLSRQTAVFAFTCGDGFSNVIIPTSGVLMAMLGLAKIPYDRWLKFIGPLFLILMGISGIFIAIAVITGF